jgi:hypothetical protein
MLESRSNTSFDIQECCGRVWFTRGFSEPLLILDPTPDYPFYDRCAHRPDKVDRL